MTTPTETPSPPTERRLFDIAGAVDYLRSIGATAATRNFVRAIIGRGEVAHVRVGRKFFITRDALDNWIVRREKKR